ncbi:MAG: 4'-phosphopantetheinyl transferase family protein [Senegalia sp. (in: firmicutes)]
MNVYAIKIEDMNKKEINNLCLSINLEKRNRIQKLLRKRDKIRTLIGEILIRMLIIQKVNIKNNFIIFDENQFGKPFLKNYPKFHFNISHSGDFVVCGIDDKPIGIDIEEIKSIKYKEIAKFYFTINEFNYIIENNLETQLARFYEIWTLKESYIKCVGQGLSISLKSFSINIDKYKNIDLIEEYENNRYLFKFLKLDSNYKTAICSSNKEMSDRVKLIEQKLLIKEYLKLI